MKFIKNTWALWLLVIPLIILSNFRLDMIGAVAYGVVYWMIYVPFILLVGLVLNIQKNYYTKSILIYDLKFWFWLVLFVINIFYIFYILLHNI